MIVKEFVSYFNQNMDSIFLTIAGKLLLNDETISNNSTVRINFRLRGESKLFEMNNRYHDPNDNEYDDEFNTDNELDIGFY
jgi:hypothetical protein